MPKEEIKTWGTGGLFANRELGSLMLMITTPTFLFVIYHMIIKYDGSFSLYFLHLQQVTDWMAELKEVMPTPFDPYAWKMIVSFMAFELFLIKYLPGKIFRATVTPTGHVPVYIANGFQSYLASIAALFAVNYYGIFDPADVYDNMPKLLSSMNAFALAFCLFLTFKGLNFPSTGDNGSNGNWIVDYFWGTELYPRIFGFDVKQFTNCRFGLMFWQIGILCYGFKQYRSLGYLASSIVVSIVVQTVYIAKFFWWETGYFCSMDIQHDRAGYYICWGCLVWVPSMYTVHTFFMVTHPVLLSVPTAIFFTACGIFSIWCNYDCDRQRKEFRDKGGNVEIWGKKPTYVVAKYTTEDGQERTSLLLTSGWWALARHFHYIPEIMASFFWCVPALYSHPLPFFYPVYLTILLADRAWRDSARCAAKYKESWEVYCKKVPYIIIPGVV